jgi:nucleotide-binding universal stress UspA family protein
MYHAVLGVDDNEARAGACARAVVTLPCAESHVRATIVHGFVDRSEGVDVADIPSVRAAASILREHGIDVDVTGSSGDPAEQLLEVAESVDADLVVLAGRKRSPTKKALFGSITQSVILNTERPVLVTGSIDD